MATSAHQIEGNNTASDWWAFEKIPGNIKNNEQSGKASDHWNRVPEDVKLIKSLHATHYRMSIEWAKIEPQEGVIDQEAITHYAHELKLLRKNGVTPIVTLHHFTHPQWFADKGGWEWKGAPAAFENYTRIVFAFAGIYVDDWVTINEPVIHVLGGYANGVFAPGEKRPLGAIAPLFVGLLKAHAKSYHALHELAHRADHKIRVGMAHALRTFDPWNKWSPLDKFLAKRADAMWNWAIPNAMETGRMKLKLLWLIDLDETIPGLKHSQDFIGVNYYSGDLVQFVIPEGMKTRGRKNMDHSDLGWDIYPRGLERLLRSVHHRYPKQPIVITENGMADAKDAKRPAFMQEHLRVVLDAIGKGIPVEGYCHWSLMDNFEWAEGFAPRFGLFKIDYATGERFRTKSADLFSEIARKNQL